MVRAWLPTIAIFLLLCLPYPVSAGRVTLAVWDWWSPDIPGHKAWFTWVEQEFEKANPDIDVQYTIYPWGEYLDKFAVSLVKGSPPDVLQLPVGWGRELFEQGVLLNLAGFISRSPEHHLRNYTPIAKHYVTARGSQFGIPLVLDATALVYNRTLLQQAGLHPDAPRSVKNWNDFIAMTKRLTRVNDDKVIQSGYAFLMGLEVFSSWLAGNGSQLFTEDHTQVTLDTKAARETLYFLHDLKSVHRVANDADLNFYSQQSAIYSLGSWSGLSIERYAPELSFGMSTFPAGPSGKTKGLVGWTNMLSIPKLVENSDAAWRYVAFCTGTKAQTQLATLGTKAAPARLDYYRTPQYTQAAKNRPWLLLLSEAAAIANPIVFYHSIQINQTADRLFSSVMSNELSPEDALARLNSEINQIWRQ